MQPIVLEVLYLIGLKELEEYLPIGLKELELELKVLLEELEELIKSQKIQMNLASYDVHMLRIICIQAQSNQCDLQLNDPMC